MTQDPLFVVDESQPKIIKGDSLDLLGSFGPIDLIVTDPPYAFGGTGAEHAITATVSIVLREAARKLKTGGWMVVFAASSYRSTAYMIESVRGIMEPVRSGSWVKPRPKTKTNTSGWKWQKIDVIAMRKGKSKLPPIDMADWIECEPVINGRRAELPPSVANWAVAPFAQVGGVFLDPFAGSGALVRAASGLGMRSFGFEKSPIEHAITCDMDDDCFGGAE
jgi:hypothetical protein